MTAIIGALVLTAAALGVTGWLVTTDRALDLLTPGPERVVQTLVGTLAARRTGSAATQMAEEVRIDADARLKALDEALRARHGDYRFEDAAVTRRDGTAEVRAHLRSSRGETFSHPFTLVRDPAMRLWKITCEREC
jgi:hypothetical protein